MFLLGRFSSMVGTGLLQIALPLYILDETNSVSKLGTFVALMAIPALLASPFVGSYVETNNKKHIMVITDYIQGVLFISLFFIGDLSLFNLGLILTISLLIEKIFDLSTSSIFSRIVDKKLFEKGNSCKSILDNTSFLISPILGTFIYIKWGLSGIFLVNGVTFLLSGTIEIFIDYIHEETKMISNNFIENLKEVIDFIFSNKKLKNFVITIMLLNLFMTPMFVIIFPYLTLQINLLTKAQYGIGSSLGMAGAIVGASFIIFKSQKARISTLINIESILIMGIGIFSLIFLRNIPLFFIVYSFLRFSLGVINTMVNVPLTSGFQEAVPKDMQGRFFGIVFFISGLLIPIGNLVIGEISKWIRPQFIIIINCFILIFITTKLLGKNENKNWIKDIL
ncbi:MULTISPECIES: MFS transporter [Psychrilyobacter]|uniref:MFS transporter n=1 Tax=Psychrilyobacter TaxID=623282 RepID=UPI002100A9A8|nr:MULTISPECIES: MFS transporter [Psychrilyobacter]MCS5422254.1 MFS transporter [Psychrilyobacter sp. S5]